MSYEGWPSPGSPRGPLPRIEELPIAEPGYDQEAVREAFDVFYRHAAQLDASLKALEAVEAFRRDAMELRSDLRSLRGLGFGQPDPSWGPSAWAHERPRAELSPAVPRLAAEAALLIGVAVVAGVSDFRPWLVVALMGAALAIALFVEWLAAHARTRVPASLYEPIGFAPFPALAERAGEPAPFVEAAPPDPGVGWSAFAPDGPADEYPIGEDVPEDTQDEPPLADAPSGQAAEPVEPEPVEPEGLDKPAELIEADELVEADESIEQEGARESGEESHEQPTPAPLAVAVDDREPWERGFDGDADSEPDESRGGLTRLLRRRR